ncbi:unnamed protein product, partial [Ectocarpus sp. 13 AM-2016]
MTHKVEDSDSAATPASIAEEHFGYLGWKWRGKHFGSKLPLCLFLTLHDRGNGHKIGTGADVLRWVREWLATSRYRDVVTLDSTSQQVAQHLKALAQKVCLGPTKLKGVGPITSITFNGHCVRNHDALRRFTAIGAEDDLTELLNVVWHTLPCQGVSQQHVREDAKMPAGAADVFPSLVRQAQRNLESNPTLPFGERGRWQNAFVEGLLSGPSGVSGVLGTVGGHSVPGHGGVGGHKVFWAKGCVGVATPFQGLNSVPRCQGCRGFVREALRPRLENASKAESLKSSKNIYMTSAQKVDETIVLAPQRVPRGDHKLWSTAASLNRERNTTVRLRERIVSMRKECVRVPVEQGEALHKFLVDAETKEVIHSRLPQGSDQRYFYEDQVKWNKSHGKAKGFRFHPATMRLAIYIQGIAGTAAYNMLRNVLHLPSPERIKQLRRNAAPPRTGVLTENILSPPYSRCVQRYGKLAATQDADKVDLMGVLTWDLMHLNKNGFSFAPNGGGLTGLVDETTFFNPIYKHEGGVVKEVEPTLEKIVATQYAEMFFVSIGKPEYKFVVWREAVRSLSTDYIQRMLIRVMRYLAMAHPDKAFDVVATICDGAPEHRSFQTHAAILGFCHWIKGPKEGSFAGFKVGFLHPVHLHEVFNMSDPMHILKKIVNALWHSDIPAKQRQLGMWCVTDQDELKFSQFSLKTAQRVYNDVEYDNDSMTPEERAATLTIFPGMPVGAFNRTNFTCMNVKLSAKVVSGTIVQAIREVRANQETRGESPDLALGCYEGLAVHLNDFVDIFNGDYGRTKFERRAKINKMKGYVTSAEDPILERLMEILRYFDDWNDMLQEFPPPTGGGDLGWKKHFITRES